MAELTRVTIFRALTQPQMFAGVTYSFFVINGVVTTEAFLIARSFWVFGVALAVHAVGYLTCLRDPRIFDLWLVRVSRCARNRDWRRHRCNTYHP